MMTFSDALRTCLRDKYCTFQGRATRAEYWWFNLFYFGSLTLYAAIIITLVDVMGIYTGGGVTGSTPFLIIATISVCLLIYLLIPLTCVTVRRFHDFNLSGWWYLGALIVGSFDVIGWAATIGVIVVCVLKGTQGPNKFGNDPLGASDAEIFA